MTVNEATKIFKSKYPNKVITGYWIIKGKVIFNTKSYFVPMFHEPAQYAVIDENTIEPVNPVRYPISEETMIKI